MKINFEYLHRFFHPVRINMKKFFEDKCRETFLFQTNLYLLSYHVFVIICHKYIISLHHYFVTLSIYKKMIKISRAMSFVSIDEKILEKGSVSNEKQSRLLRHSREHR